MAMEMMMMIPMKSSLMTVTMASISPLQGGISLADCSLPKGFSLSQVSAPWRRRNILVVILLVLGFRGGQVREGAKAEVGLGLHLTSRRGRGPHRASR